MNIGFIGLGKLGTPTSFAMNDKGYPIYGYDPIVKSFNDFKQQEASIYYGRELKEEFTYAKDYNFSSMEEVVKNCDLIFVTVQTPHEKEFEGCTRIPEERKDFDYTYLINAIKELNDVISKQDKNKVVTIISTVLPGTIRKYIIPLLCDKVKLAYSPQFIAMGTVWHDFLNPEFILLGTCDKEGTQILRDFFENFYCSRPIPILQMKLESAELAKVAYNTFITTKIVFANTIMEICDKTDADCNEVMEAIKNGNKRLLSPAYLNGGMGDSGGCFLAGEQIYTENGPVNIEDITTGIKVLTKGGLLKTVIETYKRPYKGKILRIKARGQPYSFVTLEHPFHVAKDLRKKYVTNGITKTMNDDGEIPISSMEEVEAKNLTLDHYIVFPKPSSMNTWAFERTDDLNYIRVAGYYLSEGSIDCPNNKPTRVEFNFHQKEDNYVMDLIKVIKYIYPNAYVPVAKKMDSLGQYVRFSSVEFCEKLHKDFGRYAENKKIPNWILYGNLAYAKELLVGLWRGDGSSNSEGFNFTTISKDLAYGVSILLRRFDIPSTLQYHKKRVGKNDGVVHLPSYEVRVRNAAYIKKLADLVEMPIKHQMQEKIYTNSIFLKDNGYYYHKISMIEEMGYEGTVYNLNVEDNHTYVCNSGLVNNCHPRDNIAMSWLAKELKLSHNIFEDLMKAREDQTTFLALSILKYVNANYGVKPIVILGKVFKETTNITTGSCAILLANILAEWDYTFTHHDFKMDSEPLEIKEASIIFIATKHNEYKHLEVPDGSVVIDPFGYYQNNNPKVTVHKIGRK